MIPFLSRGLFKKGIQRANTSLLEQGNVHTGDRGWSSRWPKVPPQTSDIVVYFSWARSTKNKPRSPFEEVFDLSIERIVTYDLFVRFEKSTVFRVDCVDCNLAARGIPFPENLKKIPFHQLVQCGAHIHISALDFGWQQAKRLVKPHVAPVIATVRCLLCVI